MVQRFGVHIPKPAICRICAAARGWNLRSKFPQKSVSEVLYG